VTLVARIHERVVSDLAGGSIDAADVRRLVQAVEPLLAPAQVERVVAEVLAAVSGLGPLDPLLADPEVTEVMVNGPGPVWVERRGLLTVTSLVLDRAAIEAAVERVVAPLGLRADRAHPMVDARLPDGSRVNAVMPPLAIDGPYLTIRRFGAKPIPLARLAAPEVAGFLAEAVAARRNIVVSGGTGAGKTTLLNALAGAIPTGERIVTVEDAAELRLPQPHVVRLEGRPANAEGAGGARIRDLVRNALRMRPDRIVVGECRGGEALDMLQAMNTGHEGSLTTCHANGALDTLRRLETMVLMGDVALPLDAVRDQIAASVDLIVHLRRVGVERRVTEVAEVVPGGVRPLSDGDRMLATPVRPARAA
jgi:pilus assembly protein CpaF